MKTTNVEIHPTDQMLSIGDLFLLGLQHIAAMCAGAMAVPIILGNILGFGSNDIHALVTAAFMMAGLGTLIQTLGIKKIFGSRLPMVEGVSFAGVGALSAIGLTYRATDPYRASNYVWSNISIRIILFLNGSSIWKIIKVFPTTSIRNSSYLYGIITYSSSY